MLTAGEPRITVTTAAEYEAAGRRRKKKTEIIPTTAQMSGSNFAVVGGIPKEMAKSASDPGKAPRLDEAASVRT